MSKVVHSPKRRTSHGSRAPKRNPSPPPHAPMLPPAWLVALLRRRETR